MREAKLSSVRPLYNWHRYYDPKIGRYITSDPIGLEAGLNTYAYVFSNPLGDIDPMGLAGATGGWYAPKDGVAKPSAPLDRRLNCMAKCLNSGFTVTSTSEPNPDHKPGDVHMTGQAADIRYPGWPGPWKPSEAQSILCCAGKCYFGYAQDEYRNPSKPGVRPHIHVQIPRGVKSGGRGDIPPGCEPGKCGTEPAPGGSGAW